MHFDGSEQYQGSGAGVTLKSPTEEELRYILQIHFNATNNTVEYEALLHGLRIAKEIGIKHIICCGDSDLVAQQVAGTWNARNSVMAAYEDEVDEMAKCFLRYEVKYVRRDDNTTADMLSKLGSGRKPILMGICPRGCVTSLTHHEEGGPGRVPVGTGDWAPKALVRLGP